jgi:DNA-binding MarR family transcriptional regulator
LTNPFENRIVWKSNNVGIEGVWMSADEEDLIEQALVLLPEIGRSLFASLTRHPVMEGRPLQQIKTLGYLYRHGPCPVGEVAGLLGVSMPTASQLVDRLAEEGAVERAVNPDDRRQVLVDLAPHARQVGADIHAMRHAQVRAALDLLPPAERPIFVRSLAALAAALRLDPHELVRDTGCGKREV